MAAAYDPSWRDIIVVDDYVRRLPNRPGGYLPEIRQESSGEWCIRDFPAKSYLTTGLKDRTTACTVAKAFYTKTKLSKDAFVLLLTPAERRELAEMNDPEAYLRMLAITKYLSTYDGVEHWGHVPHNGIDASHPTHIAPGFTRIWEELPTRISIMLDTPTCVMEQSPILNPVTPVPPQQKLLLLL